jgi:hypothetical protein
MSETSDERKRKYNREYQRRVRAENPKHAKRIRAAFHLRHPNARKIWNAKRSPEYIIWAALKQRCINPKDKKFKSYGAKGISVCKRWRDSFHAFIADMGDRPSKEHSIDRFPNNDGNYEPGNCRWATRKEQARNKRNNVLVDYQGKRQCLMAWSDETGIHHATLTARLKRGLKGEQLFKEIVCRV